MIVDGASTRGEQIRRLRSVGLRALTQVGVEPRFMALIAHSYHTTFRIMDPHGARYVLHVLRPEEEPMPESRRLARVESELWWLDQVRRDLALQVPIPVRTAAGEGVVS